MAKMETYNWRSEVTRLERGLKGYAPKYNPESISGPGLRELEELYYRSMAELMVKELDNLPESFLYGELNPEDMSPSEELYSFGSGLALFCQREFLESQFKAAANSYVMKLIIATALNNSLDKPCIDTSKIEPEWNYLITHS